MENMARIAGVPEHFNLPWHLALQDGAFARQGIHLEWTDVPQGTGRMCAMLEAGETDLALILTEGFVKAASGGLDAVIVQEYVGSPLQWGIHVGSKSDFQEVGELQNGRAAISRYGSGSHLMAYVLAGNMGWDTQSMGFEVVDTLDGAVSALSAGEADYFMWERFTTQALVDSDVFRRVGVCPTPWPCFVLVARGEYARSKPGVLQTLLQVINSYTSRFKAIPDIDQTLALRYDQKLEDIRSWLKITEWSQQQVEVHVLDNVINTLFELNLLSNNIRKEDFLWEPTSGNPK
ncbi:substrate-binding domain-containing protein [Robiginitalea biformata]|uniref:Ca3427-like PBP 2 domain-containing protein n=1 Tax=Robiginitalea biformata (strain ATCC BAA-864 / DSM 15991 / KCTC 12146 / HTCC2501) TaxID=313596 RepID=A4CL31_ROBBH|nr:substrate-binding domain-containing protein [Robiginitalea biformata]EAR15580.1 hypothetical protein RB2501_14669 [Robiginitalea biformata HTCC2501]